MVSAVSINLIVVPAATRDEKEALANVAKSWIVIARCKAREVDPLEADIFKDCKGSLKSLLPGICGRGRAAYPLVCLDEKNKVQAIAIYAEEMNYLHYIVTHPNNIRHRINDGIKDRVSGAGTEIIRYLAKKTIYSGLPLRLISHLGAIEFYKKLFFVLDDPESDNLDMRITAEMIRGFAFSGIKPYAGLLGDA